MDDQPLTVLSEGEGPNIDLVKRIDLPAIFSPFRASIDALIVTAKTINVTSADDKPQIQLARVTRLQLRANRLKVEHAEESLKRGLNDAKRDIKRIADEYRALIEPMETRLMEQEKIAERLEAERRVQLVRERGEALLKFGVPSAYMDLGAMSEEAFGQLLENSRIAAEQRAALALKAEEEKIRLENERLKREQSEREERERIRAENERLKKEADEREAAAKVEREAAEKARIEAEEVARVEREAAAAKLLEAQEKAERERQLFAEKARKERDAIEAKARAEKEAAEALALAETRRLQKIAEDAERARIAGDLLAQAQREADQRKFQEQLAESNLRAEVARVARESAERAERDRLAKEAAEAQAAKEAEETALRAPDREKLIALAVTLRATPLPDMASEAGSLAVTRVEREIIHLCDYITEKARGL